MQRKGVAQRIGLFAGIAFDAVRQRVHSCRRGNLAGQMFDHPRVKNHIVRDHVVVDDTDLQFLFRHGDDRVGRYFGAGAGGGGNQHDRNAFLRHSGLVQQFLHAVFIRHQNTGQFRGVHHAASAACDNQVRAVRLEIVDQLLNRHIVRFRFQIVEHVVLGAACLHRFLRQGEKAGFLNSRIREHGHFLDAQRMDNTRDILHGVFTAVNRPGHFQVVFRKHFFSSVFIGSARRSDCTGRPFHASRP